MNVQGGRLYRDSLSFRNKLSRALWGFVWLFFFSTTPSFGFNGWRIFLLRLFGARIGKGCRISASCKIWAPWNLVTGNYVCLGPNVDCYNVEKVALGSYATVSQRAFICTGSHDISRLERPLVAEPITIGAHAWICAEVFVGPGVTIGEGAVAGARTVVVRDLGAWLVMVGNPGRIVGKRELAG